VVMMLALIYLLLTRRHFPLIREFIDLLRT
jgi:hypothetical protein